PLVVQEGLYQLLEEIRDEFGKPIVVNSGYRSPEHNKNIGGAKNSYHVKGMAADIRPQHGPDFQRELKRLKQIANKNVMAELVTIRHLFTWTSDRGGGGMDEHSFNRENGSRCSGSFYCLLDWSE
ncbi:YcbK family protein, partial [Parasutterella sp.]|uniref:YcbK family protein n=1 Tax=Parasutterella sp. TaxID=2049037 RepID=UPI003AAAB797